MATSSKKTTTPRSASATPAQQRFAKKVLEGISSHLTSSPAHNNGK